MTREVYSNRQFIEFSRKQVFMRVFTDTDPEGDQLIRKFQIRGFPTVLILDASGKEVDRILGFRSAPDLMEELEEIFGSASKPRLKL